MAIVSSEQQELYRRSGHNADVYASFLNPLTLWSMQVDGDQGEGATSIPFNNGSGSHWAAVAEWQEVIIQEVTGPVLEVNEKARARVVSITSADSGVTGTLEVAPNSITWDDGNYLFIQHNYPFDPLYPWIDPATEIWYKDRDIPWTGQTLESQIEPVLIAEFSQRAGFIRNYGLVFWFDLSNSYSTVDGVTISGYSLDGVYPFTGVSTDIDIATGKGYVVVTDTSYDYYWVKFSITDSNGNTQTGYRCIFAHSSANPPALDFDVTRLTGDWEAGGWEAALNFVDEQDIPDRTFAVLWAEKKWGTDTIHERVWDADYEIEIINPALELSAVSGGNVTATFHAGVVQDGAPAPDGISINVFIVVAGVSDSVSNTTSGGMIEITATLATGSITETETTLVETVTGGVEYFNGTYAPTSAEGTYPTDIATFPQELLVGYTQAENMGASLVDYDRSNGVVIATIENLLRNEFMFSIPIESVETPTEWYEYYASLTIGRAIEFLWRWHSNLFLIADVKGLADNTLARYAVDFEPGNLYDMANSLAFTTGIRAHVVCNKEGQVCLVPDVQLLTDSERATLNTAYTLDDSQDRGEAVGLVKNPINRVALVYTSGFSWDGVTFETDDNGNRVPSATPHCIVSPSKFPIHSGASTLTMDRQVFEDEDHAKEIASRLYAQANNRYPELRYTFHGDYLDALDFDDAEFWVADVYSGDLLGESSNFSENVILRNVTTSIDKSTGIIEVDVAFEPEAAGQPSAVVDCPTIPEDLEWIPDDNTDPDPLPTPDPVTEGTGFGTVYYMNGTYLYRTRDLSAASPTWTDIAAGVASNQTDFILDPWSPSTTGYLLNLDGAVYKSTDLDQVFPSWSAAITASEVSTMVGASATSAYKIIASINVETTAGGESGHIGYVAKIGGRMRYVYTTDGGANWTYSTIPDSGFSAGASAGGYSGALDYVPHLVGGEVVLYMYRYYDAIVPNDSRLYKSTDSGVTWSRAAIYSRGTSTSGGLSLHCPYHDNEDGLKLYFTYTSHSTRYSSDGGSSATTVNGGVENSIKRDGTTTYTNDSGKVHYWAGSTLYTSTNGYIGPWSSVAATGVTGTPRTNGGFPFDGDQYYVVTTTGVFVTTDAGLTFTDKTGDIAKSGGTIVGEVSTKQSVIVPLWTE